MGNNIGCVVMYLKGTVSQIISFLTSILGKTLRQRFHTGEGERGYNPQGAGV